jgi:2-polyprenyl-6-methoxyphenol hydroxylase-like FAD-dependent oxidoreductase
MHKTDVAIVGGGLAGSLAAAMLGRKGCDAVLIDPHPVYPPDFRCEKLDGPQVATLEKTGLAQAVLKAATHDRESWVARMGRIVEKRPGDQHGILYDTLVNTVRALIPKSTRIIYGKAKDISTGADRQTVTLSCGEEISARLVVLANGLNIGLRQKLGMTRVVMSEAHSISIGFDMRPAGRHAFEFPALTYYFERPSERMAFLSMTGPFEVTDFIKIRPVDLYVTEGHRQAGIVLVGDAFATSCPAAGTGARKVLTDVERLCNVHIPRWLTTAGMGEDKITAFYDDPVKRACDAHSAAKAYHLRSFSIDRSLPWRARRGIKFALHWGRGTLGRALARPAPRSPVRRGVPASSAAS